MYALCTVQYIIYTYCTCTVVKKNICSLYELHFVGLSGLCVKAIRLGNQKNNQTNRKTNKHTLSKINKNNLKIKMCICFCICLLVLFVCLCVVYLIIYICSSFFCLFICLSFPLSIWQTQFSLDFNQHNLKSIQKSNFNKPTLPFN